VLRRELRDHLGRFGSDASGVEPQEPSPESDANQAHPESEGAGAQRWDVRAEHHREAEEERYR